jgi:hypothetical protein
MEVCLSLDLAIVTMLLCALRNGYRDCQQLKDESGIDASPNSLKSQIEIYCYPLVNQRSNRQEQSE